MKLLNSSTLTLLLFFNFGFSQDYKTSKIIVDKETNKPLEFVNINNDLDNTISNEDGKFFFTSNKNSLKISRIGYQSVATTFDAIAFRDTLFLEVSTTELDEIIVINTASLLNDVYKNIVNWYPTQPYSEKFFLRCLLNKNNEICRLQDISGKIESNTLFLSQTLKKKEYKLEVLNLRKKDIVDRNQVEYFEFLSAKNLFMWFASIFTVPSDYIFTKVKSNDPQYIKIEYSKSDQNTNNMNRNGYYIINREEKTIKEVGYKLEGAISQIPYQSRGVVKWRTIDTELVVNYVKSAKNNLYHVGHAKLSTITEVINEKKGKKDIYEAIYDLITVESFLQETVKPNFAITRDLLKANFSYSEDFWKNQNQLPLTNELKSFLNRVDDTKSIKSDFKIQGNF
jgi:hypothetical protein